MNTVTLKRRRRAASRAPACLIIASVLATGCQSQSAPADRPANMALKRIDTPAGATQADADRAALARFIGAWNFDGWSAPPGSAHSQVSGRAAATIEREHFVLIDLQATSGELAGATGRRAGSMLLASEPGIGATLTAWGDACPSISRLVGQVKGNGSVFSFHEVTTPAGRHRHSLVITFETDDRWTAEIRDISVSGDPLLCSYQFTRAAQ